MNGIELHMIGSRVLVKPERQAEYQDERTNLIVVESHAPEVIGTVVAVGDVSEVREGDVVLFTPQAGAELEFQGVPFLMLEESEILAVWHEGKEYE